MVMKPGGKVGRKDVETNDIYEGDGRTGASGFSRRHDALRLCLRSAEQVRDRYSDRGMDMDM
jgi:hypothetical protein